MTKSSFLKNMSMLQVICLVLYYAIARYLPCSYTPIVGGLSRWLRGILCKHIFFACGNNVNIERGAYFGLGNGVEIGDNSGMGVNCHVPSDIKIGRYVMMGPNCYILSQNHCFDDVTIPMCKQKGTKKIRTIIHDDVWIGRNVTFTPGRIVSDGTVIGACCLLCKDFPPYSVVGGNPATLIRSR